MTRVKEYFKKLYGDMTSHEMEVQKFTANDVIEFAGHFIWNYFIEEYIKHKLELENKSPNITEQNFTNGR